MTLITSKHFDDNFLNSEYLRIATQVNDDKGTSLLVGKNYDMNYMSSLVRALVVTVNDEYSASLAPVSKNYDRNMLGEMLNRVASIVNDGGGGGGDYVAKAVHFDGATYLSRASLTALGDDTGDCSLVYRFKFDADAFGVAPPLWVVDPEGAYTSNSFLQNLTSEFGFISNQFCNADDTKCWEGDSTGDPDASHAVPIDGAWHQLAVAVRVNLNSGSKIFTIRLDGGPIIVTTSERGTGPTLLTFNGKSFFAFSDGYGTCITGDVSDFWFAPGQYADWSDPDVMAKIRDPDTGKPVYLGANGELVTGTAPAIFFSGDASEFATNKGTGGTFTLTGALTNATTSPSD